MSKPNTYAMYMLFLLSGACGQSDQKVESGTSEEGFTITTKPPDPSQPVSQSSQTNDNGTRLGADLTWQAGPCASDTVPFSTNGSVTTTGSVDSAVITAIIDQSEIDVGLINPQDFVHDGRNKTAPYAVTVNLAQGAHSVQLCFTQSGAQGRKPKRTCSDTVDLTATCESDGGVPE